MSRFKLIKGTYKNVVNSLGPKHSFYLDEKSKEEALEDIKKDIYRQHFLGDPSDLDKWVSAWELSEINDDTYSYTQGNMDGEGFSKGLFQLANDTHPEIPMLKDDRLASDSLSFAYYDEDKILCAFSITYHLYAPHLDYWNAAIIRNTAATPDNRQVMLVGNSNILNKGIEQKDDEARASLLSNLNSKKISALLTPIFKKDGTINIDILVKLENIIKDNLQLKFNNENEPKATLIPLDKVINEMIPVIHKMGILSEEQAHLKNLTEIANKKIPNWVIISAVALLATGCIISGFLAPLGVTIALGLAAAGTLGLFIRQENRWASDAAELEQQAAYVDKLEDARLEMHKPSKDIEDELEASTHSSSSDSRISVCLKKIPSDKNVNSLNNITISEPESANQEVEDNLDDYLKNTDTSDYDEEWKSVDSGVEEDENDENETTDSRASTPKTSL